MHHGNHGSNLLLQKYYNICICVIFRVISIKTADEITFYHGIEEQE